MTIKANWGDTIPIEISGVKGFDGQPVEDFAGWEIWLTIKTDPADADPGVLQKTKSGGSITTQGGVASCEITAAESRALEPGVTYLFDVQLRDPAGRISTPIRRGKLTLTDDITKAS